MKKLMLPLFVSLAFTVHAQQPSIVATGGDLPALWTTERNDNMDCSRLRNLSQSATASKGTAGPGARWYSHYEAVNVLSSGAVESNNFIFPMWFDSTVRQRYINSSGGSYYSGISIASAAQHIDPAHFDAYNSATFGSSMYNGMPLIKPTTPYIVDSVDVAGAYVRLKNKPGIVDTLIFSVAAGSAYYGYTRSAAAWTSNYLPTGKDTLYALTVGNVDSINRAAFSDVSGSSRIIWKEILTAANGDTLNAAGQVPVRNFSYKVPGGLNVPAGFGFNITVTFKSGDTWNANVDSISMFNRFMPMVSSAGDATRMPYYFYEYNDRNMSNLMGTRNTRSYRPTIQVEGLNGDSFDMEFLYISGFVKCADCEKLGVADASIVAINGPAYPNPAQTQIRVPFSLKESAHVKASISNALGQTITTQDLGRIDALGKGQISFNTADLSDGIYFITIDANGHRSSGRFVVHH